VDAIILCGSLGEASTLDEGEKLELLRFTKDYVAGKVPVLLNVAEGATRRATAFAKAAAGAGADGLMVLPPMRYSSDARETLAFFKAVADAVPLPIMVYNNPVDYKVEVTIPMFEQLLAAHPNIQSVKESTRDISNVTRLRNAFGNDLKTLCGVDTLAMEALLMGADGWVAGLVCAFPAQTVAIYRHIQAGEIDAALRIYRWFLPLLELDIHPKLVQYIKLAEQCTGIGSEHVRAPRLPLEGAERERVLSIIQHGINNLP
jgi:1-pyrroline-4-hydroxy-2-carboxylate deaminase